MTRRNAQPGSSYSKFVDRTLMLLRGFLIQAFERRWAAQERQKKGLGGAGSKSRGRQHQLNNNLMPNEVRVSDWER
jgi:hypothetical protein